MSENDRMERAKRIRKMREGQREEDEKRDEVATTEDESETDADDPEAEPTDSTSDATTPDGGATTAATETESASDDRSGSEDGTAHTNQNGNTETEDADTMTAPVENVGDTTASVPSTEEMEAAMEQTMEQAEPVTEESDAAEPVGDESGTGSATGPAGVAEQTTSKEEATRVLEFTLADEQYCLDIEYIEEIVKQETITRVPNTPEFVEGVVDLRGQITTILNPKVAIGKDDKTPGELIVVFDAEAFEDQGHIGWVVDDVRQVSPVMDDQVNDPPMGEDYINGVIDREDDEEFVIWTTPDLALEEAE